MCSKEALQHEGFITYRETEVNGKKRDSFIDPGWVYYRDSGCWIVCFQWVFDIKSCISTATVCINPAYFICENIRIYESIKQIRGTLFLTPGNIYDAE